MKRSQSLLFLGAVVGLAVSSCQPYNYNGGGIQVAFENSKVILVDAPQVSCRSAHSTTPTADLASLSMDLGRVSMTWNVPVTDTDNNSTLKLIYISMRFRTSGLTGSDTPQIIAGQDLNCIVHDDPDGGSTLSIAEGGVVAGAGTAYTFPFELRVGGLTPRDAAKKTSFAGTASVLVYGLVHDPPNQDQPVIGRGSFQFNFGGILQ